MADFPSIVRPHQIPIYTPPKLVPQSGTGNDENLVLQVGKGTRGNGKIYQISWNFDVTLYMTKQEREEPNS